MNLPPLQFGVYALGAGLFFLGMRLRRRVWWLLPLIVPALVFAAYYLKVFAEPLWLYQIRAVPGAELLAALAGLPAGAIYTRTPKLARWVVLLVLAGLLFAPYLKFWLLPLNRGFLKESWKDGVCFQSTPSTCGPATAATLCRFLGIPVTERALATESYSTATGTEIWFLARALARRGVRTEWVKTEPNPAELPCPSIAGTQLGGPGGSGHFIAILRRTQSGYEVADPISGRETLVSTQDGSRYFTGFFLKLSR